MKSFFLFKDGIIWILVRIVILVNWNILNIFYFVIDVYSVNDEKYFLKGWIWGFINVLDIIKNL